MFPATRFLVGDYRVELSVAGRCLIDAQMLTHVLGEDSPPFRVLPFGSIFPLPISTQMPFVLTFKQIPVNIKEPFKRAARDRVPVQAYLLKKPRTLSRCGCLQPLYPSALIRFYLSLCRPICDASHGTSSCGHEPDSP